MTNKKLLICIGTLTLIVLSTYVVYVVRSSSVQAVDPPVKKKLIELGWDMPSTGYIAKHWKEMEAKAPFSGVMFHLSATDPSGKEHDSQALLDSDRWERKWFESCIDDINSCEFQRFHDNFVHIWFYPSDFDWDDEEAWRNVCDKAGICAWVARETKSNISIDFESYGKLLFGFDSTSSDRTFAETKELVRRRGAEMCAAIVKEYPQVKILGLQMNSCNREAGRSKFPDLRLCLSSFALLPSFIDGFLDSAAPETTFIDGCEDGYYMNGPAEYDRAACEMLTTTGPAAAVVAPENLQKFRKQMRAGFGFYLDMYSNPEGSQYYIGPGPGETRFERLAVNLKAALNASDEYVWVYGEQNRWWAPEGLEPDEKWTSWEEALPGLTLLIDDLYGPEGALERAKKRVFDDPNRINLTNNGDFQEYNDSHMPGAWSAWQQETRPSGKFEGSVGTATLTSMYNGCFYQSFAVEGGAAYLVFASVKTAGNAYASINIRWQDDKGDWTPESHDVTILSSNDLEYEKRVVDPKTETELLGLAAAPENARQMFVYLNANDGKTDSDVVSYEQVEIYKVP